MSKPSALAKKMQATLAENNRRIMRFAIQRDYDIWTIVLNREFGFGKERLLKAQKAANQCYEEYCEALEVDGDYGDGVIAREIKKIMGEE